VVAGETAEQTERMAWWRDARFGMFIHWGLYAVPAGAWQAVHESRPAIITRWLSSGEPTCGWPESSG
jgi:hypothetical protein